MQVFSRARLGGRKAPQGFVLILLYIRNNLLPHPVYLSPIIKKKLRANQWKTIQGNVFLLIENHMQKFRHFWGKQISHKFCTWHGFLPTPSIIYYQIHNFELVFSVYNVNLVPSYFFEVLQHKYWNSTLKQTVYMHM